MLFWLNLRVLLVVPLAKGSLCLYSCFFIVYLLDGEAKEIIKELKNDVSELTSEKVRMLQLLEEKDRQFVELESHALLLEKKYLNELKV